MNEEFNSIQELFNVHEHVYPATNQEHLPPTRSLSLRIDQAAYAHLEALADRWGYSKSGLGARLLEVALNEIELREAVKEQGEAKQEEAAE